MKAYCSVVSAQKYSCKPDGLLLVLTLPVSCIRHHGLFNSTLLRMIIFYTVSPALVNFSPSCNNTAHCLAPSALGEEAFLQREQKDYCLLGRGTDDLVLPDTFSIPTSQRWVTGFHPDWKVFFPLMPERHFFCHRVRGKLSHTAAEPPGWCDRQRVGVSLLQFARHDSIFRKSAKISDCEDAILLTARG